MLGNRLDKVKGNAPRNCASPSRKRHGYSIVQSNLACAPDFSHKTSGSVSAMSASTYRLHAREGGGHRPLRRWSRTRRLSSRGSGGCTCGASSDAPPSGSTPACRSAWLRGALRDGESLRAGPEGEGRVGRGEHEYLLLDWLHGECRVNFSQADFRACGDRWALPGGDALALQRWARPGLLGRDRRVRMPGVPTVWAMYHGAPFIGA